MFKMDQLAREAHLDQAQWDRVTAKVLDDKRTFCDQIERLTLLQTIDRNRMFLELAMRDGTKRLQEMYLRVDSLEEFKKSRVIARTAFIPAQRNSRTLASVLRP